jgi:hypothetical protein
MGLRLYAVALAIFHTTLVVEAAVFLRKRLVLEIVAVDYHIVAIVRVTERRSRVGCDVSEPSTTRVVWKMARATA